MSLINNIVLSTPDFPSRVLPVKYFKLLYYSAVNDRKLRTSTMRNHSGIICNLCLLAAGGPPLSKSFFASALVCYRSALCPCSALIQASLDSL